ncbi:MAG: hypothetical protein EHM47_14070, partial [Ignavibacteriales bacterium]
MKKILFFFSLYVSFISTGFSQTSSVPHLALQDIEFSVIIEEIPDTVRSIKIKFVNEDYSQSISPTVERNRVDTTIVLPASGNFIVQYEGINLSQSEVRVIPGILSIIPPLLA